jgi:hypothetical protein
MLPGDKAPFLEGAIVRVARPPERGREGGYAGDARLEEDAWSIIIIGIASGDLVAHLEDQTRDIESDNRGVGRDEEALVTHVAVCWVKGYGFDGDEELAWAWIRSWTGLELERLASGGRDCSEVGGHFGRFLK